MSNKFRYTIIDAMVITIAAAINAAVALGLRLARSDRDTNSEMTYGIHAKNVMSIGAMSA